MGAGDAGEQGGQRKRFQRGSKNAALPPKSLLLIVPRLKKVWDLLMIHWLASWQENISNMLLT